MTDFNRSESLRSDLGMSGVAPAVPPGGAVATAILREAEIWTSAHCELLSGIATIWTDLLDRQREAIDASARSLQQMTECRNLADMAQLQQQWLADTARRSASDFSSMARDSLALTCRVAAGDRLGARSQPSPQPSPMSGGARAKSGGEAPVQRAAAE